MRRLIPLVVAAGLVAVGVQARQDPPAPPTFRGGVDIVDVDVSVLDRHRLPVRGLTAADFTVLEDGEERPVVAYTAVDLPPRVMPAARWMADVAPDVLTNDVSREGRLVVILMDRSVTIEQMPSAVRYAEAAVNQLRPGDLAAVAYSNFGIPQNFTADRQRLLAAIRQPIVGLPQDDDGSPSECYCGVCSLETVSHIAEALLPVRQRRKMLFVVSSNMSVQSAGRCGGVIGAERQRAVRALEAANVTVYTFDPTGLETRSLTASAASAPSNRNVMASLIRQGNLHVLPDQTGGRVVSDPVRAADRVTEVFRESDSYYVLGFQPKSGNERRRFHEIRVKVNRRDVTVQARRGYYTTGREPRGAGRPASRTPAAHAGVSRELQEAVSGLWPGTGVDLSMNAVPIAMPDMRTAAVAMVVRLRHDRSQAAAMTGLTSSMVTVLSGAFDRMGQAVMSEQQTVSVPPGPGLGTTDYELVSRMQLKPGRYEVRAAVEDGRVGGAGSVYAYVDVPDFARLPVSLSGLLLRSDRSPASMPAGVLRDLVPFEPTVRRVFSQQERVTGFVRIYQGLSRPIMPGYVTAEIRDGADQSVFHQESRVLVEQFGATRALDFLVTVPTERLRPGPYVLSVEARHGNETARRDTRFTME